MNHTKVITKDSYYNDFKKGIQRISADIELFHSKNAVFENSRGQIFHLDGLVEAIQCIQYDSRIAQETVKILVGQSLKTFQIDS